MWKYSKKIFKFRLKNSEFELSVEDNNRFVDKMSNIGIDYLSFEDDVFSVIETEELSELYIR
jgi:hypothetical protein